MTTIFYPGYGSKLEIMSSPPVRVAQIRKFNWPGMKADYEDITTLDSPTDCKEYAKLLRDSGEMPFDGVFDPAHASMKTLWDKLKQSGNASITAFRVTLTDGSTMTFNAFVSLFSVGVEVSKVIPFTSTLKITGDVTTSWE